MQTHWWQDTETALQCLVYIHIPCDNWRIELKSKLPERFNQARSSRSRHREVRRFSSLPLQPFLFLIIIYIFAFLPIDDSPERTSGPWSPTSWSDLKVWPRVDDDSGLRRCPPYGQHQPYEFIWLIADCEGAHISSWTFVRDCNAAADFACFVIIDMWRRPMLTSKTNLRHELTNHFIGFWESQNIILDDSFTLFFNSPSVSVPTTGIMEEK